jgi:hypothetical protein
MDQAFTIIFPSEAWRDAFVAWMNRTAAMDFVESKEADPLYGMYDNAELKVDVSGGVLVVQEGAYDD